MRYGYQNIVIVYISSADCRVRYTCTSTSTDYVGNGEERAHKRQAMYIFGKVSTKRDILPKSLPGISLFSWYICPVFVLGENWLGNSPQERVCYHDMNMMPYIRYTVSLLHLVVFDIGTILDSDPIWAKNPISDNKRSVKRFRSDTG